MGDSKFTKSLGPDAGQDIPKCDDAHPQAFHVGVAPFPGEEVMPYVKCKVFMEFAITQHTSISKCRTPVSFK